MNVDGWKLYDTFEEYYRQGIKSDDPKLAYCGLNRKFAICQTYPEDVIIPRAFPEEELRDASNYRTKHRFPAFSYLYKHPTKTNSYPSIWRSSQTKSGLTQNRSNGDEKLLRTIGALSDKLIIYDARPYINALANRVIINKSDKRRRI
jgi:myotubularin-related protein 6/7/8